MSLKIAPGGEVTLSKARCDLCFEALWEIEQLAYLLPTVTSNSDHEALNAGFRVRGLAARCVALSEAVAAALSDDAVTTEALERKVMVLQFEGDV